MPLAALKLAHPAGQMIARDDTEAQVNHQQRHGSPLAPAAHGLRFISPDRQPQAGNGAPGPRHDQQGKQVGLAQLPLDREINQDRQPCECNQGQPAGADQRFRQEDTTRAEGADQQEFERLAAGQLGQPPTD